MLRVKNFHGFLKPDGIGRKSNFQSLATIPCSEENTSSIEKLHDRRWTPYQDRTVNLL